jgi:Flp pilus assembly protein TadD
MRHKIHRFRYCCLLSGVLVIFYSASASAQVTPPALQPSTSDNASGIIRGRVVLPSGGFLTDGVKITLQTIRGVESSIFTDNQGGFEFSKLSSGKYQIVVEADRDRFEVATESVEIAKGLPAIVTIILREKQAAGRPRAAAVSTREIDVQIPDKARKEFERASNAGREGKAAEAIVHLRKAIALYPNYLMAHNDLGAQLLELGRLDEAEAELRLSLIIDPAAFNPTLNLGIVLVKKHQFVEARGVLDKAISLQAQSPAARLYIGLALSGTSEFERAKKEFQASYELGGGQYALALFYLGQLYMDGGDRKQARSCFERYLREAPNANNLDQVRKLIAILK